MKLKHLIAATIPIFSFCPAAFAGGTVEAKATSLYVFRGLQLSEFTAQPSIEADFGNAYAGIWSALPIEKRDEPGSFGDEYDFYAGYGLALGSKVGLDIGLTRYTYTKEEDSTEAYVGLFAEFGTFSPSIYIYNDFDLDSFTIEAATTATIPLQFFPFEATAKLGRVEGDEDYSYLGFDLIYPIRLGGAGRFDLGLHYSGNDFGFEQPNDSLYGSASLRFTF